MMRAIMQAIRHVFARSPQSTARPTIADHFAAEKFVSDMERRAILETRLELLRRSADSTRDKFTPPTE